MQQFECDFCEGSFMQSEIDAGNLISKKCGRVFVMIGGRAHQFQKHRPSRKKNITKEITNEDFETAETSRQDSREAFRTDSIEAENHGAYESAPESASDTITEPVTDGAREPEPVSTEVLEPRFESQSVITERHGTVFKCNRLPRLWIKSEGNSYYCELKNRNYPEEFARLRGHVTCLVYEGCGVSFTEENGQIIDLRFDIPDVIPQLETSVIVTVMEHGLTAFANREACGCPIFVARAAIVDPDGYPGTFWEPLVEGMKLSHRTKIWNSRETACEVRVIQ